jgi:hypothetical protein
MPSSESKPGKIKNPRATVVYISGRVDNALRYARACEAAMRDLGVVGEGSEEEDRLVRTAMDLVWATQWHAKEASAWLDELYRSLPPRPPY